MGDGEGKAEVDGLVADETNSAVDSAHSLEAHAEVLANVDTSVEPKTPWQSVRRLIDLHWWRHSMATALSFAPFCIVPAIFSALAGATVNVSMLVGFDRLRVNPVGLTDLLLAMGVLLMGSILGLAFVILGFGSWLMKLSAYSIALIDAPSIGYLGELAQGDRKNALKASIAAVEPKQIHIGGVLLWVTVYMLAPFLVVLICTCVKMVTMPAVMGAMALTLPAWVDYACFVAVLPNFLFLVIFSFVSLVVAACVPIKAQKSAQLAFKLSWQFFWPLSVVCMFFVLFSFALGAPSDLVQMLTLEKVMKEYDPNSKIIAHVWASLISILLFPLSFTPICDILRPHLRSALLSDGAVARTASGATVGAGADAAPEVSADVATGDAVVATGGAGVITGKAADSVESKIGDESVSEQNSEAQRKTQSERGPSQ